MWFWYLVLIGSTFGAYSGYWAITTAPDAKHAEVMQPGFVGSSVVFLFALCRVLMA